MKTVDRLQLHLRYAQFLVWEFRRAIAVFWSAVLVGGLIVKLGYATQQGGAEVQPRYVEACYSVFMLLFVQPPNLRFPDPWYVQSLFFLLPVIGLGALADSVVRLACLVFAQKQNLPEWQRMMASLRRKHIVVFGVGKVGIRIIRGLVALREQVVAIECKKESPFLEELHELGVPVICGDGRQKKVLEQAGVDKARAMVLATNDDLANLDAALSARDINPHLHVVLRLFDDTLAEKATSVFHMPAISTSQVAAPAFIAAVTGRRVFQELRLDGQQVHLIELTIGSGGSLAGSTVAKIQADKTVNIVMHRGRSGLSVNPIGDEILAPGDTVLVIAPIARLLDLEAANDPSAAPAVVGR